MKKSAFVLALWGFAVTGLLGTLLHYVYEWTGESAWVAPFSGVNESTFEHMKLLFWPMLLFALASYPFFRERGDFWCVSLRAVLLGLLLIPVLFYTYNGAVGRSPDWLNIAFFFISLAAAYFYEWRCFQKEAIACEHPRAAILILAGIALIFVAFTFYPPKIGLFMDPVTGRYGIV